MAYDELVNVIGTNSPDVITRANVGKSAIHPKIKGYFFVIIDLPDGIFNDQEREFARKWISATATNFTPHSKTLNLIDLNAMGGVQHSYAAGSTFARDISVTYYEYQNSPIWKIHNKWINMLFDPYTGMSALNEFTPKEYKGNMIVIKTKPVGAMNRYTTGNAFSTFTDKHIENVWVYPGIVPQDDQSNAMDDDLAGQTEVMLTYTYRFDGYPLTDDYKPDLKQLAADFLNKFASDNKSSVVADDLIANLLGATDNVSPIGG
jgi:hypothetical protein